MARADDFRGSPYFSGDGGSDTTLINRTRDGDLLRRRLADYWYWAQFTFDHSITLAPPSGYQAFPVMASAALSGEDSFFTYLTAPAAANYDQISAPTTGGGATLVWETNSGNFTGRIASHSGGAGNGIITLYCWREATQAWESQNVIIQNGVIVDAFDALAANVAQVQALGNVSFTADTVSLTVAGLAQLQTIAAPSLTQTNNLTVAGLAQLQTVAATSTTINVTYSHAITLNPPAGFTALPIAAASVSTATNSAFFNPGFTPADGDQCEAPTTYDDAGTPRTLTWATSSGNMTGIVSSHTGSGDIAALTIPYWRAATQTWTSFQVHLVSGAIVQGNTLGVQSLAQLQTVAQPAFIYQAATFSHSIVLLPPAGQTAYPVKASSASLASNSFFSLLGFSPVDGDQASTPNTWNDSGTPRAIGWATDLQGNIIGAISSLAGTGPVDVTVNYWRDSTKTWSQVTQTLRNLITLSVNRLDQLHTVAAPTVVQGNTLPIQGVVQLHTVASTLVAGPGTPVTYARALALNPPVGRLAFPISAATARQTNDSIFQYLQGAPNNADQCAPPTSYLDGVTTRSITWETDGSGNMTGRVSDIDGSGQTVLSIPYWASQSQTWFTLTITLQDASGAIITGSVTQQQTVASPTALQQGSVIPAKINQDQVVFSAGLTVSYGVQPAPIAQLQTIEQAGVATQGNIGVFPLAQIQTVAPPALVQLNFLATQSLVQLQVLPAVSIGLNVSIEPDDLAQVTNLTFASTLPITPISVQDVVQLQLIQGATATLIDSLAVQRMDIRQMLASTHVDWVVPGTISANFLLYPVVVAKISVTPG